jgi:hypothetical protein
MIGPLEIQAIDVFAIRKMFSFLNQAGVDKVNLTAYFVNPPSTCFVNNILAQGSVHISEVVVHYTKPELMTSEVAIDLAAWKSLGVNLITHISAKQLTTVSQENVCFIINVSAYEVSETILSLIDAGKLAVIYAYRKPATGSAGDVWAFMHPYWKHLRLENYVSESIDLQNLFLVQGRRATT